MVVHSDVTQESNTEITVIEKVLDLALICVMPEHLVVEAQLSKHPKALKALSIIEIGNDFVEGLSFGLDLFWVRSYFWGLKPGLD